jgi:hypothetical protein
LTRAEQVAVPHLISTASENLHAAVDDDLPPPLLGLLVPCHPGDSRHTLAFWLLRCLHNKHRSVTRATPKLLTCTYFLPSVSPSVPCALSLSLSRARTRTRAYVYRLPAARPQPRTPPTSPTHTETKNRHLHIHRRRHTVARAHTHTHTHTHSCTDTHARARTHHTYTHSHTHNHSLTQAHKPTHLATVAV